MRWELLNILLQSNFLLHIFDIRNVSVLHVASDFFIILRPDGADIIYHNIAKSASVIQSALVPTLTLSERVGYLQIGELRPPSSLSSYHRLSTPTSKLFRKQNKTRLTRIQTDFEHDCAQY